MISISRFMCASALLIMILVSPVFGQSSPATKESQADKAAESCVESLQKLMNEKNVVGALAEANKCVNRNPKSALAHYWLGMTHFFNKEAKPATESFKEAYRLAPDSVDIQLMLRRMYTFDKEKFPLSIELLERALQSRPDSMDIRFDLARVYAQTDQIEKCFGEFAFIFDNEMKFAMYRTELAKILIAAGEKDGAREMLQRALAIDPRFEPATKLLEELKTAEQPADSKPAESGADKSAR